MSVRPTDHLPAPTPEPLQAWPDPPADLSPEERAQWEELGSALLPLQTISAGDLLFVADVARERARLAALRRDSTVKVTALNALARQVASMLEALGLTPRGRRTTAALPPPPPPKEADPLADL
jgi:hypothetical protein